jgi:hypothetical protein
MTPFVEGVVVQIMAAGACEVVLANNIAVAFAPTDGCFCRLNDRIRFSGLLNEEGAPVLVENLTRQWSAQLSIKDNDVHDLRIPCRHGSTRTPSKARLLGE